MVAPGSLLHLRSGWEPRSLVIKLWIGNPVAILTVAEMILTREAHPEMEQPGGASRDFFCES